jgi:putative nucleotidyltransferase with HDIG domain
MCAAKQPIPFPINKDLDIPSIPLVLIRIIQALDADTRSARDLEDLILHDPSLAARILKLANSAFYSLRARVKTISHAITLLGMNLVTSLAIGISVFDAFARGSNIEADHVKRLWTHSCSTAVLAKEVWTRRGGATRDAEFAFLCGLLHDIGKVVFFKAYPGHYSSLMATEKSGRNPSICAYEWENYGVDHTRIGEKLAVQWGFPLELVNVIRKHHDYAAAEEPMVNAVMLADLLTKDLKIGYDGDNGPGEEFSSVRSKLEVSEGEYKRLTEYASRERGRLEDFFQIS